MPFMCTNLFEIQELWQSSVCMASPQSSLLKEDMCPQKKTCSVLSTTMGQCRCAKVHLL